MILININSTSTVILPIGEPVVGARLGVVSSVVGTLVVAASGVVVGMVASVVYINRLKGFIILPTLSHLYFYYYHYDSY